MWPVFVVPYLYAFINNKEGKEFFINIFKTKSVFSHLRVQLLKTRGHVCLGEPAGTHWTADTAEASVLQEKHPPVQLKVAIKLD